MFIPISPRSKLLFIFLGMFLIVLICSISMVWNSHRINTMLTSVMQKDLALYKNTREMELTLANLKGYLTSYFVDENAQWLTSMADNQQRFKKSLDQALSLNVDDQQTSLLQDINLEYNEYLQAQDKTIEEYRLNSVTEFNSGAHKRQQDLFLELLGACESLSLYQWQTISQARERAVQRSQQLVQVAIWLMAAFIGLCSLFVFVLYRQILRPIRNLAIETAGNEPDNALNDVAALSHSVKDIMKGVDETQSELNKSRKNLAQAERMAVVGELAAGVAHTIRNPLTSIKMRMFSLARSLDPSREQDDDLQVISSEIDRIDKIVNNFIGFARPPKLKFENHHLEKLVRSVADLMKYQLNKSGVKIDYDFKPGLSPVRIDGDRFREALLNLLTNSCEAMISGGTVRITEYREHISKSSELAVLSILDDGPGIPESAMDKVTTPFFTTKIYGSGLGLSTVARIVEEHGGKLIIARVDTGCKIVIKLPV